MRADGTTFRPRHTSDHAGKEDSDGREELGGVPHRDVVGVETRGLRELPLPPEWIEASE